MRKIGQNPKIGQIWRPAASQPYVVEKSWPISETLWRWTTTWSKQYLSAILMHPVSCISCSEMRCLFERRSISDFWGKWPLKWKFPKISFRIHRRDTELRFVTKFGENRPLRSCWKVACIDYHAQINLRSAGLFSAPKMGRSRPKLNSLNVVTPWHVHVYRIWSGSAALCRTHSGKVDFLAQKVICF